MEKFQYNKSLQALTFFCIAEGGQINSMKALKLIWLSDRLHLRKYGRPIIGDEYFAMKNGPVASSTRNIIESSNISFLGTDKPLKKVNQYVFKVTHELDTSVFSETDISVMQDIYDSFGMIPEFELSEMSHIYPEWSKFREVLESGDSKREKMDYINFFEDPELHNHPIFRIDPKIKDFAKEIFCERVR